MADIPTKRVFISHSSFDRKVADTLCKAIESRGLACWIASRDVPLGDDYQDVIVKAIEDCSAMVLVFSLNSNNSQEVKKELALAGQHFTPVIPVRVEDVLPVGAFRYELATRQWIDLFRDWEGAVERIVERIYQAESNGPRPLDRKEKITWPTMVPRWLRRSGRLPLLMSAVAALTLFGSVIYVAGFSRAYKSPELVDPPAQYPETDETRLDAFSICTPQTEYKAGFRRWTRVAPDRWTQEYPDGSREYFNVISRTRVGDCDGSIVRTKADAVFQVFLPDKGCPAMEFLFRRLPVAAWISYVHIDKPDVGCRPAKT